MESPEVRRYLRALAAARTFSEDDIVELEDHLHCAVEQGSARGLPARIASARAVDALGPIPHLVHEYEKVTTMKPLSRFAGISIACVMLALAILPSARLTTFVHIPSLLLVLGLVSGGLIASFGPVAILRCLRQAFTSEPLEERGVEASLRLARHGYRLSWAAGIVGVIVGVVLLLQNLSDPPQIGNGLALSLLTLLYGALLAELGFSNLAQWLTRSEAGQALARR